MRLTLKIHANNGLFTCDMFRITSMSPWIAEQVMTTTGSLTRDELFLLLLRLKFHEQDIHDAFDIANNKRISPDAEALRREVDNALEYPNEPWRPSVNINQIKFDED